MGASRLIVNYGRSIGWGAVTSVPFESHGATEKTERVGFEPTSRLSAATRFPVALFRPLRHLSIVVISRQTARRNGGVAEKTERVGFEPTRALRPYRFSRAAPSTGLEPPLRYQKTRREQDSNLRGPEGPNGFQDRRIQPLCHLSLISRLSKEQLLNERRVDRLRLEQPLGERLEEGELRQRPRQAHAAGQQCEHEYEADR